MTVSKACTRHLTKNIPDVLGQTKGHLAQYPVFCSFPLEHLALATVRTELNKNPVEGFSAGLIDDNDLYRWEVLIIGPPDTLYEGGVFKAHLTFPKDYPLRPPKMKFITEIWHPNERMERRQKRRIQKESCPLCKKKPRDCF
nr:ubiquitin-conjugating enzyme E2 G1 isoform X2 [Caretta caretta]